MMHEVTIFTDGACSPNPGRGGWAAILVCNGREKELTGNDPDSTNQKMELQAVIEGLKALRFPCRVKVVTDSQGVCAWMTGVWRRKKAHIRQLCAEIEAVIEAGGHDERAGRQARQQRYLDWLAPRERGFGLSFRGGDT
jgi:ribonuclease HI